jgi:hypothetical protein
MPHLSHVSEAKNKGKFYQAMTEDENEGDVPSSDQISHIPTLLLHPRFSGYVTSLL